MAIKTEPSARKGHRMRAVVYVTVPDSISNESLKTLVEESLRTVAHDPRCVSIEACNPLVARFEGEDDLTDEPHRLRRASNMDRFNAMFGWPMSETGITP